MAFEIDETHDPRLMSWVESANDPATDFPIQNLPLVFFQYEGEWSDDGDEPMNSGDPGPAESSVGMVIGDQVLDLAACADHGLIRDCPSDEMAPHEPFDSLQEELLILKRGAWGDLRRHAVEILRKDSKRVGRGRDVKEMIVRPLEEVEILVPTWPRGYTDFYASIHHAMTVGSMFRPESPLLPNYKWVPIGYHGRASSIVPSGTKIRRPRGQVKADDAAAPEFGPCRMLDYELEVGCIIAGGNKRGEPIPVEAAEQNILGLCLVNDWSARDMQKWEYQPLGPFLAKNFATSVSPYVVTLEALAPFRCPAMRRPEGDPAPLPYLSSKQNEERGGFDITLDVWLTSKQMRQRRMLPVHLSKGSFRDMYWTMAQLVAHHASNGCNLEAGDLLASGTVSGESQGSRGCLLELTWQGRDAGGKPLPRKPIALPTGETRLFLEDGDEVVMKAYCEREGFRRIGFGECRGIIEPAG